MHLFYQPGIIQQNHFLSDEESKHGLKVLRLKPGDFIHVIDGIGGIYKCRITSTTKRCEFQIIEKSFQAEKSHSLHIAISPTKNQDRIEWFVEKATEIGVDTISFMLTQNSEKTRLRMDRINKKAISAIKQSGNLWLPKFQSEISFPNLIDISNEEVRCIAYVDKDHQSHFKDIIIKSTSTIVLIGPEGDFSKDEIKQAIAKGFQPVSLGKNRLRTETAGLIACHTFNLINE